MKKLTIIQRVIQREDKTFKEFKFQEGDINETFQYRFDEWTEKDDVKLKEELKRKWAKVIATIAERQANIDAEDLEFEFEEWPTDQ